jgi:hypothetical protein
VKPLVALSVLLAFGGCVQSAPTASVSAPNASAIASLRVTNNGALFSFDQGAAARKTAEAACAAQGRRLRPGIYDRFEGGTWVYPGGCI